MRLQLAAALTRLDAAGTIRVRRDTTLGAGGALSPLAGVRRCRRCALPASSTDAGLPTRRSTRPNSRSASPRQSRRPGEGGERRAAPARDRPLRLGGADRPAHLRRTDPAGHARAGAGRLVVRLRQVRGLGLRAGCCKRSAIGCSVADRPRILTSIRGCDDGHAVADVVAPDDAAALRRFVRGGGVSSPRTRGRVHRSARSSRPAHLGSRSARRYARARAAPRDGGVAQSAPRCSVTSPARARPCPSSATRPPRSRRSSDGYAGERCCWPMRRRSSTAAWPSATTRPSRLPSPAGGARSPSSRRAWLWARERLGCAAGPLFRGGLVLLGLAGAALVLRAAAASGPHRRRGRSGAGALGVRGGPWPARSFGASRPARRSRPSWRRRAGSGPVAGQRRPERARCCAARRAARGQRPTRRPTTSNGLGCAGEARGIDGTRRRRRKRSIGLRSGARQGCTLRGCGGEGERRSISALIHQARPRVGTCCSRGPPGVAKTLAATPSWPPRSGCDSGVCNHTTYCALPTSQQANDTPRRASWIRPGPVSRNILLATRSTRAPRKKLQQTCSGHASTRCGRVDEQSAANLRAVPGRGHANPIGVRGRLLRLRGAARPASSSASTSAPLLPDEADAPSCDSPIAACARPRSTRSSASRAQRPGCSGALMDATTVFSDEVADYLAALVRTSRELQAVELGASPARGGASAERPRAPRRDLRREFVTRRCRLHGRPHAGPPSRAPSRGRARAGHSAGRGGSGSRAGSRGAAVAAPTPRAAALLALCAATRS